MNFSNNFRYILITVLSIANLQIANRAIAIKAPDGTVSFEKSPLLIDSHATFNNTRVGQARYYFDLELPGNIGESLQRVTISQRQGSERIKFILDKTKAYLGTHNKKQEELNFTISQNEESKAISIIFDRPIAPGNRLTIGLKPRRNPDFGGVYLFGITAFPVGTKSSGLYLGAGRLHFYQNHDSLFGH